ncbi:MAG: phage head closure protein [Allorhizobium sp.]
MGFADFDPGAMTARLALEAPVETADGQGGVTVTHSPVAAVWARIEQQQLSLDERAGGEIVRITHHIWIRRRSDIFAGMRFSKGVRVFVIKAFFDPDESGRYLICRCEEEGR